MIWEERAFCAGKKAFRIDYRVFDKNSEMIDRNNVSMVISIQASFLLCCLVSCFAGFWSNQFFRMRTASIAFSLITIAELLFSILFVRHHIKWASSLVYLDLSKICVFCIFSGVLCNMDGPAILIYVFLMLSSAVYMLHLESLIAVQLVMVSVCSLMSFFLKSESDFSKADLINGYLFLLLAWVVDGISFQSRIRYYKALDEANDNETLYKAVSSNTRSGLIISECRVGALPVPVFENEGLFKLLGITKEIWDSGYFDDPLSCVHPDDIENANQLLSSLNNEGDSADAVYRLRKGDGNYLWVHVAATLSNGKMYACYTDFEK